MTCLHRKLAGGAGKNHTEFPNGHLCRSLRGRGTKILFSPLSSAKTKDFITHLILCKLLIGSKNLPLYLAEILGFLAIFAAQI